MGEDSEQDEVEGSVSGCTALRIRSSVHYYGIEQLFHSDSRQQRKRFPVMVSIETPRYRDDECTCFSRCTRRFNIRHDIMSVGQPSNSRRRIFSVDHIDYAESSFHSARFPSKDFVSKSSTLDRGTSEVGIHTVINNAHRQKSTQINQR